MEETCRIQCTGQASECSAIILIWHMYMCSYLYMMEKLVVIILSLWNRIYTKNKTESFFQGLNETSTQRSQCRRALHSMWSAKTGFKMIYMFSFYFCCLISLPLQIWGVYESTLWDAWWYFETCKYLKLQYLIFFPQSNYTGSSLNNGSSTHSVDGKSHSDVILIPPIGDGSINSQVCHGRGWVCT